MQQLLFREQVTTLEFYARQKSQQLFTRGELLLLRETRAHAQKKRCSRSLLCKNGVSSCAKEVRQSLGVIYFTWSSKVIVVRSMDAGAQAWLCVLKALISHQNRENSLGVRSWLG